MGRQGALSPFLGIRQKGFDENSDAFRSRCFEIRIFTFDSGSSRAPSLGFFNETIYDGFS